MSNPIQRYYVTDLHYTIKDRQSVVVLYDDHIAEVEKVRYNLEEDKQCLSEDIEKLQARIDELEGKFTQAITDNISLKAKNQIQAEGIKGMFEHYGTRHPTEREIDEWLDKLEKGE